jgi:hypothetical protein
MTKDEALKLALEALTNAYWPTDSDLLPAHNIKECGEAITAIKAALEAKDEPVGSFMTRLQAIDFLLKMRPQTEPTEKQIIATIDAYSALFGDMIESPVLPKQEAKDKPVAWDGYNLDDMCEAFNRVIEEHFHRKHPFHDPVNNDAMIALRTLRGFIPYMKRHTTPPQRKPLTDEQIEELWDSTSSYYNVCDFARAIEAAHGIKGEA